MAFKCSLSVARNANQSLNKNTFKPTVLVVGGTSGIGQHTAQKLAQYTSAEKIIITGRNKQAGDSIVADLFALTNSPSSSHEFVPCDVSLMRNVRKFGEEIKKKTSKLNLLVISAGFLSTNGRDETEEGIDKKLACNFYSRFLLIKELLPLLENAAKEGEEARVLTVLAAGKEGPIFKDDLDLKQNFSLMNAANVATTYNSLMIEEYSNRHPNVSFMHIYPGYVNTSITDSLPWYLRIGANVASVFATSPEDSGEVMCYVLTDSKFKSGWHLLDEKGNKLEPSVYQTPDNRQLVWDHAEHLTSV
eukprot:TRINITY_DN15875_c0_g1_i1.p1 TRINITY_DN15875_c0_g1~~TRINITY_DN15875_c0_g1_i1.p1  ORF type:complete len:304 (+),score=47.55 TRINITY_DN15875_c0_g1_i1:74-985(+)